MIIKELANRAKQAFLTLIGRTVNADVSLSESMYSAVELWSAMYEDKAPWLNKNVPSLGIASAVAAEAARLITLENTIEITGSPRADFLNEQIQPLRANLRYYTEYACAKGGIAFKPYVADGHIAIDAVQADRFFPTAFDSSGNITGAVFIDTLTKDKKHYCRAEYHQMQTDNTCIVRNRAFISTDGYDWHETALTDIDKWAQLDKEAKIDGVTKPLFGYYRVALANRIESLSPLGMSIYANAVDRIKDADEQYGRLLWEFEGGELAIDVDYTILKPDKKYGFRAPKGKERLFRTHNFRDGEKKTLEVFSPELRDSSLLNGLNAILRRIEFNCGLAYGTLSNTEDVAKTATEIKASKQRSYTMVADNQRALETALNDLIYAMDVWTSIDKLAPNGEYSVNCGWDDSIVTDAETEQRVRLQEVQAGLLKPEVYLMWRYGIKDEEEAKKLMPDMATLTDDNA